MKHTDFYNKYREIEAMERAELKKAVMAHGGEFRFVNEDGEEIEGICAPIIMASGQDCNTSCDFIVSRVSVVNNILEIYGVEKEWGVEEEWLGYIEAGHLHYIIDEIPETEDVKDVTII